MTATRGRTITDEAQLRAIIGTPVDTVQAKLVDRLNHLTAGRSRRLRPRPR
jgi:hypothetical protein